jgi:hypothetical protein
LPPKKIAKTPKKKLTALPTCRRYTEGKKKAPGVPGLQVTKHLGIKVP